MSLATDLFWFLNYLCNISFHLSPLGPSKTLWFCMEPIQESWKTEISFISKISVAVAVVVAVAVAVAVADAELQLQCESVIR